MDYPIFTGLLQNIAILLSIVIIYDYLWAPHHIKQKAGNHLLTGALIGLAAIILMLTPWTLVPGIVFDTRSILLSISGLFLGIIPTLIAMGIAALYRIILGGEGLWMGLAVILSSGSIGILWRHFRPAWQQKRYIGELLAMGFIVHIVMLLCVLLIPAGQKVMVFRIIFLPVLILYPVGTLLLGMMLIKRQEMLKTRRALQEQEQRYRHLYESMEDAYVMADLKGNYLEFNSAFQKLTGYSAQELKNMNYREITPEQYVEKEEALVRQKLKDGDSSILYQKEYRRKDGSLVPTEVRLQIERDEEGKPGGLWGIVRDISERKKAEEELILAREKAEESNRLKSVFLANMSHEIRTPMNAVMGFASLLTSENVTDAQRIAYSKTIQNSGNHLLNLIDDIVDISKIEAKQLQLHLRPHPLHSLFTETLESFQQHPSLAEKPALSLKLHFPEQFKDTVILTDRFRFQQVLNNLIDNALKFSEQGSVEIGFEIPEALSGSQIRVYVKDKGPGIPPEMQSRIFERFHQLSPQGTHQGTGLGLSICKGIVEAMGGEIFLESSPGKGTSFYFTLPFKEEEGNEDKAGEKNISTDFLKGLDLLIAEDDEYSFLYLQELFRPYALKIRHARDGEELMKMLENGQPDLLLLDINMPRKNGMECLQEIRETGYTFPVIAQTAYAMADERQACMDAGCRGYITKPLRKENLLRLIRDVLAGKQAF
jgi:hypothetical protein